MKQKVDNIQVERKLENIGCQLTDISINNMFLQGTKIWQTKYPSILISNHDIQRGAIAAVESDLRMNDRLIIFCKDKGYIYMSDTLSEKEMEVILNNFIEKFDMIFCHYADGTYSRIK